MTTKKSAARAEPAAALAAFLTDARADQPDLAVGDEPFLDYVRRRASPGLPLPEALDRLRPGDLLLAFAASQREPTALARLAELCAAAAKENSVDREEQFIDELRQALLVELLVSKEARPPKLLGYRGSGRLASWLAAVALGTALSLRRKSQPDRGEAPRELEASLEVLIDWNTPELMALRHQSRARFQQAFHAAVRSLDAREQNVLRLRCIEGATDGAIAAFYRVTRASVVRWLAAVREKLLIRTRAQLTGSGASGLDSLLRTLAGELTVSLGRFFHDTDR